MADYRLCFHWLKHLQKDKIYVVLSCVGRKQKDLELNTCFLCRYLHVSITEIHDNFREPYQYLRKYMQQWCTYEYYRYHSTKIIVKVKYLLLSIEKQVGLCLQLSLYISACTFFIIHHLQEKWKVLWLFKFYSISDLITLGRLFSQKYSCFSTNS